MSKLNHGQVQEIILKIAQDPEVYAGGCFQKSEELIKKYGVTQKQIDNIQIKLFSACKLLRGVK